MRVEKLDADADGVQGAPKLGRGHADPPAGPQHQQVCGGGGRGGGERGARRCARSGSRGADARTARTPRLCARKTRMHRHGKGKFRSQGRSRRRRAPRSKGRARTRRGALPLSLRRAPGGGRRALRMARRGRSTSARRSASHLRIRSPATRIEPDTNVSPTTNPSSVTLREKKGGRGGRRKKGRRGRGEVREEERPARASGASSRGRPRWAPRRTGVRGAAPSSLAHVCAFARRPRQLRSERAAANAMHGGRTC